MRNLNIALRSLFKKERHNMTKILSLGIGLAVALVLIAKICFERSFDSFYPDVWRQPMCWTLTLCAVCAALPTR